MIPVNDVVYHKAERAVEGKPILYNQFTYII